MLPQPVDHHGQAIEIANPHRPLPRNLCPRRGTSSRRRDRAVPDCRLFPDLTGLFNIEEAAFSVTVVVRAA
jgi:hypothetical protein